VHARRLSGDFEDYSLARESLPLLLSNREYAHTFVSWGWQMALVEPMRAPFVLPNLSDIVLTAKFFRALGDPTRLRILQAVMHGEKNVSELVEITGSLQGRVSSHLACLRWCGYVTTRRDGRNVYYRVTDPRVRKLVELAAQVVRDHVERIRTCTIIDRRRAGRRRSRGRRAA
jgi:DNA-binding transcriptional ArsR family regulator